MRRIGKQGNSMAWYRQMILLVILPIAFCGSHGPGLKKCRLTVYNAVQKPVQLSVEIADTDELRARGLMDRKAMDRNNGMLFVFNEDALRSFWMKNTHIPLQIAYIDNRGIIREIYAMKPLDISLTYPSRHPVRYALEVNQGWFSDNNIKEGCRVMVDGCIGK